MLAAEGFQHYEISNWCQGGFECQHNLVYWHGLPYIGVGVAAHSYIDGHRLANTSNLDEYIEDYRNGAISTPVLNEEISRELQLSEAIILGLRLKQGINLDSVKKRFGMDVCDLFRPQIEILTCAGLLELMDGSMYLTARGRLLGNEVFQRFLPAV